MKRLNHKIKILYVGFTEIGDSDATGTTLKNIFEDWNDVDIMQYSLDYSSDNHSGQGEKIYINKLLSPTYFIVKSFYRKRTERGVNSGGNNNRSFTSNSVSLGKAVLDVLPKRLSFKDQNAILDFKPDIIYTLAENISTLRVTLKIAKKCKVPIIVHIMDDIESTIYTSSKTISSFRRMYLHLLNETYKYVPFGIAISKKMADEYQMRHGKIFITAMNCIESLPKRPYEDHPILDLVFSGGLHGGRAYSLLEIGKLIQNNPILKGKMHLVIYTSRGDIEKYGAIFDGIAELNEYVPREEYFENLYTADVLLHVESFEENEINYFKYSMSTKIPEYLSVGRPVFCYGPMDICTVEFLKNSGAGLVASSHEELEKCLLKLVNDYTLRNDYANRSYCQSDQFTKERVRSVLLGKLSALV